MPPVLFALAILEIVVSLFFPQAGLDHLPSILGFLPLLGLQALATMPKLFSDEMRSRELFARVSLELQSSQSQPPK
jgi:hypothetical protein